MRRYHEWAVQSSTPKVGGMQGCLHAIAQEYKLKQQRFYPSFWALAQFLLHKIWKGAWERIYLNSTLFKHFLS